MNNEERVAELIRELSWKQTQLVFACAAAMTTGNGETALECLAIQREIERLVAECGAVCALVAQGGLEVIG